MSELHERGFGSPNVGHAERSDSLDRVSATRAGATSGPSFGFAFGTWRLVGCTMGISVFGFSCAAKDGS